MVDDVDRSVLGAAVAMAEKIVQVGFRFPSELLARLDERVEREKANHPGRSLTRADLVREYVLEGLESRDREDEGTRRRKKRPKS